MTEGAQSISPLAADRGQPGTARCRSTARPGCARSTVAWYSATAVDPCCVTDFMREERVRRVDIGVGGGKLGGDPVGVAVGQRGRLRVLALLPVEQECLHGRLGGLLAAEAGREADSERGHDERKHGGHLLLAGEQRLPLRRLAMPAAAGARSGHPETAELAGRCRPGTPGTPGPTGASGAPGTPGATGPATPSSPTGLTGVCVPSPWMRERHAITPGSAGVATPLTRARSHRPPPESPSSPNGTLNLPGRVFLGQVLSFIICPFTAGKC